MIKIIYIIKTGIFLSLVLTFLAGFMSGCSDDEDKGGDISINNPPIAEDQIILTPKNIPVAITLFANDDNGDSLDYFTDSNPENGSLIGNSYAVIYTPDINFTGLDSFTFHANDGVNDSNTATITIKVNIDPVAEEMKIIAAMNRSIPITLCASDDDGDDLQWSIDTQPSYGSLSGEAPDMIYTPNTDYTGADSFTFHVNDGMADSGSSSVDIELVSVRYVDIEVEGAGHGASWEDAFRHPQDGADAALEGEHVWIAEGRYTFKSEDHSVALEMKEGVTFCGGFNGTEASLNERDLENNETILDGYDGIYRHAGSNVVKGADNSCLNGLIITGGHHFAWGSGMYNLNCSPEIINCIFRKNSGDHGPAIYNIFSSPTIKGCTFLDNTAMCGPAIYNIESSPVITDCDFRHNTARYDGGAIYNLDSSPVIKNCSFTKDYLYYHGESAGYEGGAIYNDNSTIIVENCYFNKNCSGMSGGAISNHRSSVNITNCNFKTNATRWRCGGGIYNYESSTTITNCLFSDNHTNVGGEFGGAIANKKSSVEIYNCTFAENLSYFGYGGAISNTVDSALTITNSILWGNNTYWGEMDIHNDETSTTVLYYSNIKQEGYEEVNGNISKDPLYTNDYHLWPNSPCIDSADGNAAPELDMEGGIRYDCPDTPNTGTGEPDFTDMGIYEYH